MLIIGDILQLDLLPSDFTVYVDRNKSSLIVSFANHLHKRSVMNALHQRKSLLAEEIYPKIQSNANIYANDQLTPYFAKLFQYAWQAKKEGRIFSASSLGGRIKVKLADNSPVIIIETHHQLDELINENMPSGSNAPSPGRTDSQSDNNDKNKNTTNNNETTNTATDSLNNQQTSSSNSNQTNSKTIVPPHPATTNQHLRNYLSSKATGEHFQRSTPQIHRDQNRATAQHNRSAARDRAYRSDFRFESNRYPNRQRGFSDRAQQLSYGSDSDRRYERSDLTGRFGNRR